MTLNELQSLKTRLDQGVILHKGQWLEILEWAIELTKHHEGRRAAMQANDKERVLTTKDPITGKQVPFTTWRPELTPEQKAKCYDDLAKGVVPF